MKHKKFTEKIPKIRLSAQDIAFLKERKTQAVVFAKQLHKDHGTKGLLQQLFFWVVGGISVFLGLLFIWIAFQPIPSISSFESRKISNGTTIYDRTGTVVLYGVSDSQERIPVESDQISQYIKDAIVAIEDERFYEHSGVRIDSTARAIAATLLSKFGVPVQSSGGSTITQQVVKNTLLTSERDVSRKLKEWFLAIRLEQKYSKEDILTIYLNEAPFGGTMYGVETAANQFFGKSADSVTIAEAAYLAAIPNKPTRISPYGKHLDELEERKNTVLYKMKTLNLITPDEYARARSEKVTFLPKKETAAKAIHFVEYVRSLLEEQYGPQVITDGGFKVITTLDWDIQKRAEEATKERALQNEKEWNASNAGVVVLDPKTGDILAMVGSRGYEDPAIDGKYNVTIAQRQPGSSFKPIIYAESFEQGFLPETKLLDVRTQFGTRCEYTNLITTSDARCYAPENYDSLYKGPVSLRDALGQSRNVPAVKLLYLVTPERALSRAYTMGIRTLTKPASFYGLSLVLGGGEVRLLDMVGAYGTFANEGVYNAPNAIQSIESKKDGVSIYTNKQNSDRALSVQSARMINSILSDNTARTPLFGSRSFMYFEGRDVAAKTGTTNNNRDAWLIGYTPDVVVGVWVGNNDNTPMKKGSAIAGPLWREIIGYAMTKKPSTAFIDPAPVDTTLPPVVRGYWYGNESFTVDTISGKLATEYTPSETKKEYIIPNPGTILKFVTPGNLLQTPTNPTKDNQYQSWSWAANRWIANNPNSYPIPPTKPTTSDTIHTKETQPKVSIRNNMLPDTFVRGMTYTIPVDIDVRYPIKQISAAINGTIITQTTDSTAISIEIPSETPDSTELSITVTDDQFNKGSDSVSITVGN